MTYTPEPTIIVNGRVLTSAEAMAVRVAVSSLRMELSDPGIRRTLGPIADDYDRNLASVEQTILNR
jgi:hypothetical protein